MTRRRVISLLPVLVACAAALFVERVEAQCEPQWQPGDPAAWLTGSADATAVWDPDGSAGPTPVLLVVGGRVAGGSVLGGPIAAWDGSHWSSLGDPPGDKATALGVYSGKLVAALSPEGGAGQTVATFDGAVWQVLGMPESVDGRVQAFAVYNGELFAGGTFTSVGGQPTARIARWNGATWTSVGSGVTAPFGASVQALATFAGKLYVGGVFTVAGGTSASCLASWNGSAWSAAGNANNIVRALAVRSTIDPATTYLFAGGDFTTIGGVSASRVARLDALTSTWTTLSSGPPGAEVESLLVRFINQRTYELAATTRSNGASGPLVSLWNGTAWTALGSIDDPGGVTSSFVSFHGGAYTVALRTGQAAVRRFDGAAWAPVAGPGVDGEVRAVLNRGHELVIGGAFRTIDGQPFNGVARGNPGAWQPMGSGMNGTVRALARASNGDVIAVGEFTMAGGQTVNHVARWNGSAWAPIGGGTDAPIHALAVRTNGEIVVAGLFSLAGGVPAARIARWNGAAWSALSGGSTGVVHTLLARADGSLIAGGDFQQVGSTAASNIARWTTSGWSALGAGTDNEVFALAEGRDGRLLVGGRFASAGGVTARCLAAWDGATWHGFVPRTVPVGIGAIVQLPDGDLALGGAINVGTSVHPELVAAARWNNGQWADLGIRQALRAQAHVLLWRNVTGDLWVGGSFPGAGDQVSGHLARLWATCPAYVNQAGSGCNGSAGPLDLISFEPPWIGGRYRAHATGFAQGAIALDVLGTALPATPLSTIHPAGAPGCDLLVNPIATRPILPTNGAVTVELAIPNVAALVGATVRDQVVEFDFGAGGALTRLASTNALDLTAGVF